MRLIESFEPRLADLGEKEQDLRAVETIVAACEERSQTLTADLDGHVSDCEVRARIAMETMAHLDAVSMRTLPELQRRLEEADKKHQSIDQKIAEAVQIYDFFDRPGAAAALGRPVRSTACAHRTRGSASRAPITRSR